MSSSSPFRTDDDNNYVWPPSSVDDDQERIYARATKLIELGLPKETVHRWRLNFSLNWEAEHLGEIATYFINSAEEEVQNFSLDQDWFDDCLRKAENTDQRAFDKRVAWEEAGSVGRIPNNSFKVRNLRVLTPKQRFVKYIKDLPDQYARRAAERGTAVHKALEDIALGKGVELNEETHKIWKHVENGIKFFEDFELKEDNFLEVESVIYNDTYSYAGQFDALIKVDVKVLKKMVVDKSTGELWTDQRDKNSPFYDPDWVIVMVDYKTGDKGPRDSVAIQFSLYDNAEFIGRVDGTKDPLPLVHEHWAVSVTDKTYKVYPIRVDETVWEKTKAVIGVADWAVNVADTVMGQPLRLAK